MISQNKRRELDYKTSEINPAFRQVAHFRFAILKAYHSELSKIEKPKMKGEVMREFLNLFNSGLLLPDQLKKPRRVCRSSLYSWSKAYRDGGFRALIPKYRSLQTRGSYLVPIDLIRSYKKITIPGPPLLRGKHEFLRRLREQWQGPPLDCPIIISIFFFMPVPKGTSMGERMRMLKDQLSPVKSPRLSGLTDFVLEGMHGVVYKDHSQFIQLHSEKHFRWCPKTQIFIRGVSG